MQTKLLEPKIDLEPSEWTCPFCNQTRKSQAAIEKHILKHSGEKPFACELCDYVTNRKDKLTRHSYTHSAEKPFACNFCEFATSRKDKLKNHIERLHPSLEFRK